MEIVERTGLSWPTVNSAIKRYQAAGESALMPLARGRKSGTCRVLSAVQEAEIRDCIRKRRPKFYGLKKSLWDRGLLQQLIANKFCVELSERVTGNYLHRWDLTSENHKGRGYDSCAPEVRRWLDINFADRLRQARDGDEEVYWLTVPKAIKIDLWCPGPSLKLPLPASIAEKKAARRLTMVAASNSQGKLHWALCNGVANATRQIKFFEALLHDNPRKKLVLIRANMTSYNSAALMAWVRENSQSISVFPEAVRD